MRDLRDPQRLGESYLAARDRGESITKAVSRRVRPYRDGGHISNDPAKHHSKTPQKLGDLNDGGMP